MGMRQILLKLGKRIAVDHAMRRQRRVQTSSFWSETSRVVRQPPLQNPDSALARADRPLLAQGHKARDVL